MACICCSIGGHCLGDRGRLWVDLLLSCRVSNQRHIFRKGFCKKLGCFLFTGAADEDHTAVDEMEGISYKRKDFGGIYPKALMAVDESMRLQSRQQFFRGLAADHCFMELDHLCLVADLLQIQNFGDRYALSVAPLPDPDGRCLVKALFQSVQAFIQGGGQVFCHILL